MRTAYSHMLVILFLLLLLPATGYAAAAANGAPEQAVTDTSDLPDTLPVVELPAQGKKNDVLAVILSGDGGWADLDRDFGEAFQQKGMDTVGFDCFKYFSEPRHPPGVAKDLETILYHYLKAWGKKRILLLGYSFGATWLPLIIDRLPTDLQNKISLVALLAPGLYTNIEIKMYDWLTDIRRPGALDVTASAKALRHQILCVYSVNETEDSLCPQLSGINRRIIAMPGDHHFNHDYAPIEETILNYFK